MLLANIITCTLIVAYFVWICIRGWTLAKQTLSANSAQELLINVLAKKRFYFQQAIASFGALALLAGVKAMLILASRFSAAVFSAVVFGTMSDQNVFDRIGWGGVFLAVASIVCWYQHLKANHHLQVLYAFRKQLELKELE